MTDTGKNNGQNKTSAAYGKVIARAWRDLAFKAKLLADPHGTLKDEGVPVPAGMTVTVVENTDTHVHFVLPSKPSQELSDEALEKVAGGTNPLDIYSREYDGFADFPKYP